MAREACGRMFVSIKAKFDSFNVRNSVLIISHITFRDFRVLIFSDNPLEIAVCKMRRLNRAYISTSLAEN